MTPKQEYARQHYLKNKEKYLAQAAASNKQRRVDNRFRLWVYLLSRNCMDCGETDPIVLQFDHVRGEKFKDVGAMVNGTYAWKTIETEIAKCEIVCANCHLRRTSTRAGWYKTIMIEQQTVVDKFSGGRVIPVSARRLEQWTMKKSMRS
jgi:hypothetical protein